MKFRKHDFATPLFLNTFRFVLKESRLSSVWPESNKQKNTNKQVTIYPLQQLSW